MATKGIYIVASTSVIGLSPLWDIWGHRGIGVIGVIGVIGA
ncbi:hypothetical protein GCM10027028_66360 [Streptomyces sundarbansensis]